jgi:2-iminobutanoate/2-iminopropanoate deaminase
MEKLKNIIATDQAPAAIGPYSQAVCVGGLVFLSGQLALDPATGALVEGGIREQTEQAFRNIEAILAKADLTVDNVIKTTVFLADINDFAAMNEVYARHFSGDYPARSAVQVAALPKGGLVEIECICSRGMVPNMAITQSLIAGDDCGCKAD